MERVVLLCNGACCVTVQWSVLSTKKTKEHIVAPGGSDSRDKIRRHEPVKRIYAIAASTFASHDCL